MSSSDSRSPARRPSAFRHVALATMLGVGLAGGTAQASPIIDGINRQATPAYEGHTLTSYTGKDAGWYYTPTFTYDLDGIYSQFLNMNEFAATVQKTLTVQVQTERPVNGGVVLGQASFNVQVAPGGYAGGTFVPVRLTAGTKYFIDLLNVQDVGINLATWANDGNGNPQPAGGATVNLGAWYSNAGAATSFATQGAAYGQSSNGLVNVAGGEPILFFAGTAVPEPSALAGTGSLLPLLLIRRRRRDAGTAVPLAVTDSAACGE